MCGDCKKGRECGSDVTIDWSRIPEGLNEVRQVRVSGSLFAGPWFRVRMGYSVVQYKDYPGLPDFEYKNACIVATRPKISSYMIVAPGLQPDFTPEFDRVELQRYISEAGYGPQIKVYEVKLVAESKDVEVKTVQTQLVWNN